MPAPSFIAPVPAAPAVALAQPGSQQPNNSMTQPIPDQTNLQGKIGLAREQYRHAIASEEPIIVRAAQAELALLPPAK